MHIRRRQIYVLTLSCFSLAFLIYRSALHFERIHLEDELPSASAFVTELLENNSSSSCTPIDHLFFLKTHKCASSTVQNVLMRRGLKQRLNFVLPDKGNYIGHPYYMDESKHIGKGILADNEHFDMFVHHTRYTPDVLRRVMPSDSKWVTIMRNPVALFDSSYNYFNLGQHWLQNSSLTLKTLLTKETQDIIELCENRPRHGYAFGHNQMAFDLGLDEKQFRNETAIAKLISSVSEEFDLVLISDFMLVSMVLLADLLCWPLEQVAFVSLNARESSALGELMELERKKILELNNVDDRLYNHFLRIFKSKVEEYGVQRMEEDVKKLAAINEDLALKCLKIKPKKKNDQIEKVQNKIDTIELLPKAPAYCAKFTERELVFTEILRQRQRNRFRIKADLKKLLA